MKVWIPGTPGTKGRDRGGEWRRHAVSTFREALLDEPIFGGQVNGPITVYMRVGQDGVAVKFSTYQGSTIRPLSVRGDIDNYAKLTLDAAVEAGVMGDDSQVFHIEAGFVRAPYREPVAIGFVDWPAELDRRWGL
jgi:Holliday junction resolvase RusA-like endonuclease